MGPKGGLVFFGGVYTSGSLTLLIGIVLFIGYDENICTGGSRRGIGKTNSWITVLLEDRRW